MKEHDNLFCQIKIEENIWLTIEKNATLFPLFYIGYFCLMQKKVIDDIKQILIKWLVPLLSIPFQDYFHNLEVNFKSTYNIIYLYMCTLYIISTWVYFNKQTLIHNLPSKDTFCIFWKMNWCLSDVSHIIASSHLNSS